MWRYLNNFFFKWSDKVSCGRLTPHASRRAWTRTKTICPPFGGHNDCVRYLTYYHPRWCQFYTFFTIYSMFSHGDWLKTLIIGIKLAFGLSEYTAKVRNSTLLQYILSPDILFNDVRAIICLFRLKSGCVRLCIPTPPWPPCLVLNRHAPHVLHSRSASVLG